MGPTGQNERLSQIGTLWTQMFQATAADSDEGGPPRELVLRYYGAVYRYLLGAVRDEDTALDLAQEFARRFLRGDFRNADPARGRFRDFLKASLRNLVNDHWKRQQKVKQRAAPEEIAEPAAATAEDDFETSFRDDLLARTWEALATSERETGRPFCTVLLCKTRQPDLDTAGLVAVLEPQLGKHFSEAAMRQTLHRARVLFSDLLLDEVGRSAGTSDLDRLAEELVALNLLEYCRSALERRRRNT
jgi:RNA polymerase sigma-70 factor (ECF subfamily)